MREGDIVRIRRGAIYQQQGESDTASATEYEAESDWTVAYAFAYEAVLQRREAFGVVCILVDAKDITEKPKQHTITLEDGTKVEISDESYQALRKAVK